MTYKKNEKDQMLRIKVQSSTYGTKFIFTIGVWYDTVFMNPPLTDALKPFSARSFVLFKRTEAHTT